MSSSDDASRCYVVVQANHIREVSLRRRSWLLAAMVIIGETVQAQVVGQVVDRGRPVPGAQVDLWSPTERLARRITNDRGEFRIPGDAAAGAVAIAVRRIGYRPTRIAIDPTRAAYVIELVPLPSTLPEVSTREAAKVCPNVESAEARAIWGVARGRYLAAEADTLGKGTKLSGFADDVRADSLGVIPPARINRGYQDAVAAAQNGGRRLIRNAGYVRPLSSHSESDFGIWGYASLHSWHAGHFAAPHFAEHHTLSVLARDATEITLAFCPRSRKQTGLEGTLRLGADTTFIGARWTYWNPHRQRESAGGEVTFNPPGPTALGARAPLLAANGLFWRKLANGRYWQRWQEYERWILSPSGRAEAGADSARTGSKPPAERR